MASSVLSFLSSPKFALYKITPENVASATCTSLKIVKVVSKYRASVFRHRREDGSSIVDARIVKEVRVDCSVIAPDDTTLSQLVSVIEDRSNTYIIQSRGLLFRNMLVDRSRQQQNAQMLTGTPIQVSFKELLVQSSSPVVFASSGDSSLIDKGMQLLQSAENSVSNLVSNVTSVF